MLPCLAPLAVSDVRCSHYISPSACVIKFLYTPKIPQRVVVQQIKAQCCDPKIDVNHNVTSINVTNRSLRRGTHTHATIVSCGEQRMIYLNAPPFKTKVINNWSHIGTTVSTFSL